MTDAALTPSVSKSQKGIGVMDEQAATTGALDDSTNHREHSAEEAASTDPARAFAQALASEHQARQAMTRRIDDLERTLTTRVAALEQVLAEARPPRTTRRQLTSGKPRVSSGAEDKPRTASGGRPKSLEHRIREARNERSLSQAALAKKLGISSTMISFWETGRTAVPEVHLQPLAKALRVSERFLRAGRN
jgi:DNA-binding XRE family transcriptional regulator